MNNILITGAASGIGKATAIFFKRKGWQVGLLDIDSKALADLSAQLEGAWYSAVDVTDYTQVQQAISDLLLCMIVNCACYLIVQVCCTWGILSNSRPNNIIKP